MSRLEKSLFFVCRVLDKPDRLDYVVLQSGEFAARHDVQVASKGFATKAAAEAVINQLGGTIPDGLDMYLDNFEENFKTVGAGKMTARGAHLKHLGSEREAVDAWNDGKLIFDPPPF
jgi:hypothetical protein